MEKQDRRVKKTLESIEKALFILLESRSVDKITVTELVRVADINKGTFYLHYTDIFDLYNQTLHKYIIKPVEDADYTSLFFDDPDLYTRTLVTDLEQNSPMVIKITRNRKESFDFEFFIWACVDSVYRTGRIEKDLTNDMKLASIFGSLIILNTEFKWEHTDEVAALISSMIKLNFPGETSPGSN